MDTFSAARRDLLRLGSMGLAAAATNAVPAAYAATKPSAPATPVSVFDIRTYGAIGDGKTVDTPAINKAMRPRPQQVAVLSSSRPGPGSASPSN